MRLTLLASLALTLLAAPSRADTRSLDLVNGDKVSGDVIEETADRLVLDHPVFGRIEVPLDQIKPPKPPNPGLFGSEFLAGWKRSFSVGLTGSGGNSRNSSLRTALDLDYADEHKKWIFDAVYSFASSDSVTSEQFAFAGLERVWLFPGSRWFTFGRGRFDYDRFRTWSTRLQGAGGVGYNIVKRDRFALDGRLGGSLNREFNEDDFFVEALVGLDATWRLTDDQTFTLGNTWYPALNENEYRNVTTGRWRWSISESPALSLNAGFTNEYQTNVASDRKRSDLKYFTSLGLDF